MIISKIIYIENNFIMKKNILQKYTAQKEDDLISVINKINTNDCQSCIILNKNKVVGSFTDGDLRRYILKNGNLDTKVSKVMNKKPIIYIIGKGYNLKTSTEIKLIPKTDSNFEIKEIYFNKLSNNFISNAVILAGGKGERLLPLTLDTPKPLIKINKKPIIYWQIKKLEKSGIKKIYFITNYKHKLIKEYLSKLKTNLEFEIIKENIFLGTAGGLSFIKNIRGPVLVQNCDVLTKLDYNKLFDYYFTNKCQNLVVVKKYSFNIPYGVIKHEKDKFISIDEKPKLTNFISSGIYILEESIKDFIPKNIKFDMNDLLVTIHKYNHKVHVYPITENWIDIGNWIDLKNANNNFKLYQ